MKVVEFQLLSNHGAKRGDSDESGDSRRRIIDSRGDAGTMVVDSTEYRERQRRYGNR